MKDEQEITAFEQRVEQVAAQMHYPPTPDIAGAVMRRMSAPRMGIRWGRRVQVGLLSLLVIASTGLAVPEVRASLLEIIRLGAVRIIPITVTLTPEASLSPAIESPAISGRTTLEQARAGFQFYLPENTRLPDEVYVQNIGGTIIILVWRDQAGGIEMALHLLGPEVSALKLQPEVIEQTSVNGKPALWTEGPYPIVYEVNGRSQIDQGRLIEGHVLIWLIGEVTYRLESSLSMEQAITIAETIHP